MFYNSCVAWKTAAAVMQAAVAAVVISLGVFGDRAIATRRCQHCRVS
jgi:hypothetical protein